MNLAVGMIVVFGLFSWIGGVMGFVKAGSKASLIAGTISGLLLLASAYGIFRGNRAGYFVSLVIAISLGLRFFRTWRKTHRLMPDLLMILLSLATIFSVVLSY